MSKSLKILINRGNIQTPKSYPSWEELLVLLKDYEVKEIKGILPEQEIIDLVNWSDVWCSVDSFLPHLVKYHNLKPGVVIWGKSDPKHFGYKENVNLLKDKKYLRPDQFRWWNDQKWNPDDFVSPNKVFDALVYR